MDAGFGQEGLLVLDMAILWQAEWLGTRSENSQDMCDKGRQARGQQITKNRITPTGNKHHSRTNPETLCYGDDHWTHNQPERLARGERVSTAKLTRQKVVDIRQRYASGETNKSALGREYGVNNSAIGRIIRKECWAHIE